MKIAVEIYWLNKPRKSVILDEDAYDLISAEIESFCPQAILFYMTVPISITKSDGSSNFDIRWIKSVSSDGGETLLKLLSFFITPMEQTTAFIHPLLLMKGRFLFLQNM